MDDFMDEARRIAWKAEMKAYQKEMKKEHFKRKVEDVVTMVNENIPAILALTPAVVTVARTATNLVGTVGRTIDQRDERKRRECKCYDRSEGHYWTLKRKLTNADWTIISKN